jgi:hypothetical protein
MKTGEHFQGASFGGKLRLSVCRSSLIVLFFWALAATGSQQLEAREAAIVKVLPHLLDPKGRISLAPSLYERDAYQLYLREHPNEVSGLRFDVQWKAARQNSQTLELRIEVRGHKMALDKVRVFSQTIKKPRHFSTWSSVKLDKAAYQETGELIAWRATLWDGEKKIAEQQSFLW